ncbi:MAG: ferrochelatase [Nitrospinae bacterium]|nr:ferrochelatase [Nitrospinota bacterium]
MIAVLLLAFGCPDSIESIEPFITNVMNGRKPSPNQLQKIKERYLMIGGHSPLLDITKRQAEALEKILNATNELTPKLLNSKTPELFRVFVGMRYWHPFIKDTLNEIKNSGAENIVALAMAPHYSKISTGNYIKDVNIAKTELNIDTDISFINNWHTHPLFLEAVAEKIKNGISNFPPLMPSPLRGEGKGEGVQVIYSAHSLPKQLMLEDDPYAKQLNETIEGIIKLTGDISWHLGFQSKGMSPGEWLEPTVDSILDKLSKDGKKYILIVPVGFVSDNIETLYDIDIVYKGMAESLGMIFHRTDSLNDSPKFIESLSCIIRDHLKQVV